MGFGLGDALKQGKLEDKFNNLIGRKPPQELQVPPEREEEFYTTNTATIRRNWYKQQPYAFIFTDQNGTKKTFNLPIAPSNLTINTHWATNVVTTMYGTVEEHSEQRYYDITIAGTTGMVPRFYKQIESQINDNVGTIGRSGFAVKESLSDIAGGFFQRTLSVVENTINQVSELFNGKERPTTGVNLERTGYIAFHNFYKFLLEYKKDTSSAGIRRTGAGRSGHPLRFVNYKDNNQYDVSVQQFQLTRSADEPFLYNYNIVLRAYNLRSADAQEISIGIQERKEALGLDGVETSLRATMFNKAAQAKRAAYGAIGAAKGFGS